MPLNKILDGRVYSSREMDKTSHQTSCRSRNWKTLLVIWACNLRKRLPVSFAKVTCYQVPSRVWETNPTCSPGRWLCWSLPPEARGLNWIPCMSPASCTPPSSTLPGTFSWITRRGLERSLGMD